MRNPSELKKEEDRKAAIAAIISARGINAARAKRAARKVLLNGKSEAQKKMQDFLANNVLDYQEILVINNAHSMSAGDFEAFCIKYANTHPHLEFPNTVNYNKIKGLTAKANDDALKVAFLSLLEIFMGKYCMAFRHILFFVEPLKALEEKLKRAHGAKYAYAAFFKKAYMCIECIDRLSILKQQRLAKRVNDAAKLALQGKDFNPHGLKTETEYNDLFKETILNAISLGIKWSSYINTTDDDAEIVGVSNPYCYNQSTEFTAMDNIVIFLSKDGSLYTLVILRVFAPGINSVAWAGGMFDVKECGGTELDVECANRELKEETGVDIDIKNFANGTTMITGKIDVAPRQNWDLRLRAWNPSIGAVFKIIIMPGTSFYVPQ